jgi:hypothetical protein
MTGKSELATAAGWVVDVGLFFAIVVTGLARLVGVEAAVVLAGIGSVVATVASSLREEPLLSIGGRVVLDFRRERP